MLVGLHKARGKHRLALVGTALLPRPPAPARTKPKQEGLAFCPRRQGLKSLRCWPVCARPVSARLPAARLPKAAMMAGMKRAA